jgi:hypothetical protein
MLFRVLPFTDRTKNRLRFGCGRFDRSLFDWRGIMPLRGRLRTAFRYFIFGGKENGLHD